jgi:hypothetical protein
MARRDDAVLAVLFKDWMLASPLHAATSTTGYPRLCQPLRDALPRITLLRLATPHHLTPAHTPYSSRPTFHSNQHSTPDHTPTPDRDGSTASVTYVSGSGRSDRPPTGATGSATASATDAAASTPPSSSCDAVSSAAVCRWRECGFGTVPSSMPMIEGTWRHRKDVNRSEKRVTEFRLKDAHASQSHMRDAATPTTTLPPPHRERHVDTRRHEHGRRFSPGC